jgi:Zn-finger nucleic acid-binding protein
MEAKANNQCPRCRSATLKESDLGEYGFVVVDTCSRCGGIWLDKGELDRLDDSVWTNTEALSFKPARAQGEPCQCPRCSAALEPISPVGHDNLVLDRCPKCLGFWLDKGELDGMRALAGEVDAKIVDGMTLVRRPAGWTWLRWAGYAIGNKLIGPMMGR